LKHDLQRLLGGVAGTVGLHHLRQRKRCDLSCGLAAGLHELQQMAWWHARGFDDHVRAGPLVSSAFSLPSAELSTVRVAWVPSIMCRMPRSGGASTWPSAVSHLPQEVMQEMRAMSPCEPGDAATRLLHAALVSQDAAALAVGVTLRDVKSVPQIVVVTIFTCAVGSPARG
jgi:hypothetical protein